MPSSTQSNTIFRRLWDTLRYRARARILSHHVIPYNCTVSAAAWSLCCASTMGTLPTLRDRVPLGDIVLRLDQDTLAIGSSTQDAHAETLATRRSSASNARSASIARSSATSFHACPCCSSSSAQN